MVEHVCVHVVCLNVSVTKEKNYYEKKRVSEI